MKRERVGKFILPVWFTGMALVVAGLLARHLIALPAPSPAGELGNKLASLRGDRPEQWLAVHVLASECLCSAQVVEHLIHTTRPPGWSEVVLWVGGAPVPVGLPPQFRVERRSAETLSRDGIESAPLLVLVSPDGQVRYSGGYTDRKQGPVNHDLQLMAQAREMRPLSALPLFGCPVSDRLKRLLSRIPGI